MSEKRFVSRRHSAASTCGSLGIKLIHVAVKPVFIEGRIGTELISGRVIFRDCLESISITTRQTWENSRDFFSQSKSGDPFDGAFTERLVISMLAQDAAHLGDGLEILVGGVRGRHDEFALRAVEVAAPVGYDAI